MHDCRPVFMKRPRRRLASHHKTDGKRPLRGCFGAGLKSDIDGSTKSGCSLKDWQKREGRGLFLPRLNYFRGTGEILGVVLTTVHLAIWAKDTAARR